MKKVNNMKIREEIEKIKNVGETENVKIYEIDRTQDIVNLGVNWSGLGTVTLNEAQEFINELQKVVNIARTFKYEGFERD